ncbi:hypothetical protein niasHT_023272 [Heterodera trifolii]|uniref:Uncharacterized protein n=1 Tax=Heterodera trifolii TaxID=157864 RepID=A0ABD2JDF0_9BILA
MGGASSQFSHSLQLAPVIGIPSSDANAILFSALYALLQFRCGAWANKWHKMRAKTEKGQVLSMEKILYAPPVPNSLGGLFPKALLTDGTKGPGIGKEMPHFARPSSISHGKMDGY